LKSVSLLSLSPPSHSLLSFYSKPRVELGRGREGEREREREREREYLSFIDFSDFHLSVPQLGNLNWPSVLLFFFKAIILCFKMLTMGQEFF
jgi:hypothetical protein